MLNTIWFILIAVLLTGYAILDGFDLGVGAMYLFSSSEEEKRLKLNAIGPVWDGNEVWLLAGGGALFAAFPIIYATVFSGFYLALMLLLFSLILRAISLEFRGKVESPGWKMCWDWIFSICSLLPAVLFGVAVGNIIRGIPVNQSGLYTGNFFTLLNPYAILVGVFTLVAFIMHANAYMLNKTEGKMQEKMKNWTNKSWVAFVVLWLLTTFFTIFAAPYVFKGMSSVLFWIFLMLIVASVVYVPVALKKGKYVHVFASTSVSIASLIAITAVGMFPTLVPSSINTAYSLTVFNSSSSQRTLLSMLIIALIGMPVVIVYTIFIYRIFRGSVKLTEDSY